MKIQNILWSKYYFYWIDTVTTPSLKAKQTNDGARIENQSVSQSLVLDQNVLMLEGLPELEKLRQLSLDTW